MANLKSEPRILSQQTQSVERRYLVWSGYAVFIWSIAYMLPHLYWALDGTVGLSLLKPSVSESPDLQLINWIASVILTAAGFLGVAVIYLKQRGFLRWILLSIVLAGCSISASHGVYGVIYRILQITGVIELDSGSFNLKEHTYVLWDLVLFEPWFIIEGILLGVLGWCYVNKPRSRRIWLTCCIIGISIGLITGLLGVRFA